MTIEQTGIVDFISTSKTTGDIVLTISDHLDWADPTYHIKILLDKLNCYLSFCQSGQLHKDYPSAKGKNVIFSIAAKWPYPDKGLNFVNNVKSAIEKAGFNLEVWVVDPAQRLGEFLGT
jgi:hypothetical protein